MTAAMILQLIISLGKGVLIAATKAQWPAAVLDALSAGIASFEQVHGTLVTKDQLEALRIDPNW